jgi:CheY-like chemotaxis protein
MQRNLVIDDDPAVTSVLKRGLAYERSAVYAARSGREGLAIARGRPPELVILDIMMAGMDGLEVLQRLRSDGTWLPVQSDATPDSKVVPSQHPAVDGGSANHLRSCWWRHTGWSCTSLMHNVYAR